ncbi:MAG: hypothetical protein HGA38_00150 [Candidatus Moranbacteria bacterium]|nr:hypothetical protein [Candidatus Moranbacteria bacterium]NTW45950.1 hypothetical protein [Candidatus Moranbacteria bacterium]
MDFLKEIGTPVARAAGVIEDATPVATILANALSLVLGLAGAFAMLSFAVAGVAYALAGGDESRMRQAKNAMVYSVIGALVCVASLVVVRTVAGVL